MGALSDIQEAAAMEGPGAVKSAVSGCIHAAAPEDMRQNYRQYIQETLRSVNTSGAGARYSHSDIVSLEGCKGLPCISLKGIGRLALPICVEQEGKVSYDMIFLLLPEH